jgi:hypothetical protein
VIVFCPVSGSPHPPTARKALVASDDVFSEMLRLADIAFGPFEASSYGAGIHRQRRSRMRA